MAIIVFTDLFQNNFILKIRVQSKWTRNHFIILKGHDAANLGISVLVEAVVWETWCEMHQLEQSSQRPRCPVTVILCCQSTEQPKPISKVGREEANKPASLEI
jgi:hypothetical protein